MRSSTLRPKSFLALLDAVYGLYRWKFSLIFWISAVLFLLPILYWQIVSIRYFGSSDIFDRINEYLTLLPRGNLNSLKKLQELADYSLPVITLISLVTPLSYAALINAIHLNTMGKGGGFWDAFTIGWRTIRNVYLGFLLIASLVTVLLSPFLGLFYFAVGASNNAQLICSGCVLGALAMTAITAFIVTFCFYFQCIVIEKVNPFAALARCIKLILGGWWRAFALLLLIFLINSIIETVSETSFVGFDMMLRSFNPELEILGKSLYATGMTLVRVFLAPVIIITQTMLFYDVKVRREAFDVELMIDRFESSV